MSAQDEAPLIDEAEVRQVARLARLALTDAEVRRLQVDLGKVLIYADALSQVDTEGVEPTYSAGAGSPSRVGELSTGLSQARALALAPDTADDGFRVPRVL